MFEDWLVFIKHQDGNCFRTEKKIFISQQHIYLRLKFTANSIIRGSNIFSIKFDIFWLKYFVKTNLKIILGYKFYLGLFMRNFAYNNNLAQNDISADHKN